jgi:DNA-binding FadR family transcriptional regulator
MGSVARRARIVDARAVGPARQGDREGSSPDGMVGDAVFRPVRTGNAFEETVERILAAIKLGVVAEGGRLPPERELAARLKVSRVTLRDAIRALQDAGYVVSRPGRHGGSFVTHRTPDVRTGRTQGGASLADTVTFRSVLEPGAAALAAARTQSDATRARLLALLAEAEQAGVDSYRQADSRLHLAIVEAAGSPSLLAAVADVRVRVNDMLDAIPLLPRNIVHANRQHRAIVSAVLAGQTARAYDAMSAHLEGTAALLRGFLVPAAGEKELAPLDTRPGAPQNLETD